MRRAALLLCALLVLEAVLALGLRTSNVDLESQARTGSATERIAALHSLAGRGSGELPPADLLDAALDGGPRVAAYLLVEYKRHPQRAEIEARIRAHPALPADFDPSQLIEVRQPSALARALALP